MGLRLDRLRDEKVLPLTRAQVNSWRLWRVSRSVFNQSYFGQAYVRRPNGLWRPAHIRYLSNPLDMVAGWSVRDVSSTKWKWARMMSQQRIYNPVFVIFKNFDPWRR